MIIILKQNTDEQKIKELIDDLKLRGLSVNFSKGKHETILGLIGDTVNVNVDDLFSYDIVNDVKRITEPFKLSNRKFHNDDTKITALNSTIGAGDFGVIAGPCSVESVEQVMEIATKIKKSGANFLRGGAFKPRTSPYAFRGLKAEGIEILLMAKKETGLPIVSELTSTNFIDLYNDVDIIQVGARNMQNFDMLLELGRCNKPILLKRGLSNTIEELLMSAEYIMSSGNNNVILCERGIRTFETTTRNTLDISAVPYLKSVTHLPVIVDPSHATGISRLVKPLTKAAVVAGADGVIIEVHHNPKKALCDGAQSITPEEFEGVMSDIKFLCQFEGKKV